MLETAAHSRPLFQKMSPMLPLPAVSSTATLFMPLGNGWLNPLVFLSLLLRLELSTEDRPVSVLLVVFSALLLAPLVLLILLGSLLIIAGVSSEMGALQLDCTPCTSCASVLSFACCCCCNPPARGLRRIMASCSYL